MIENKLSKQAINEIHRKVGRNILLYQKIELILKYLLSRNNVSGKVSELKSILENRMQVNSKKTLGGLMQGYVDEFFKAGGVCEDDFDDAISLGISISIDVDNIGEIEKAYQDIVLSRNCTVHNLLERFDVETVEQCSAIESCLDSEYDKAKSFFNDLKDQLGLFDGTARYCSSEVFKSKVLNFSNADDMSRNMASEIIQSLKRDDGWVVLSQACNVLKTKCPELFPENEKSNRIPVKKVMESSGLFEFSEEKTDKGVRILFRIL